MSSRTRTRTTRTATTTTTTGSTATLRSVPDQTTAAKVRTDTEDKLWEALHANPNSTATDLSGVATIGKSTAQKILVKWAADGSVTRTAGIAEGGRRAADLWAITEGAAALSAAAPVDQDDAPADDADATDTAQADPDSPVTPDATDTNDAAPAEDDPTRPATTEPTDAAADNDVQGTADTDATDPAQTEPADDGAATDSDTATDSGGGDKARLASGALRGMVEDYLHDHPGQEFGPTAIANALGGKSSGAVSNALDKLVEDGVAVKTQDKPRRFALAPAEAAAAPAPRN
jgi:hypothetical protein